MVACYHSEHGKLLQETVLHMKPRLYNTQSAKRFVDRPSAAIPCSPSSELSHYVRSLFPLAFLDPSLTEHCPERAVPPVRLQQCIVFGGEQSRRFVWRQVQVDFAECAVADILVPHV